MNNDKTLIESAIETLRHKATGYADIKMELITRPDLGAAGFEKDLHDDAKAMKQFARRVVDCSWQGVPLPVIQDITNKFDQLKEQIERIGRFDFSRSSNVNIERQNLITNFKNQWRDVYQFVAPHLCFAENADSAIEAYLKSNQTTVTQLVAEADAAKQKFQTDLEKLEASFKSDQERMKILVEDIEKMAQRSGVTNQAVHFKELADNYRVGAILWFIGSVAAGIVLFNYVKNLTFTPSPSPEAMIETLVPHLITVTLLSTALIFCIRNFSSLMHNVIVNRHRQTALTTFTTFVNSTDDAATRNAVLVQSTQAIFSPQPSGYLKTDTEMPQMNQVTEIVRGIAGKDK